MLYSNTVFDYPMPCILKFRVLSSFRIKIIFLHANKNVLKIKVKLKSIVNMLSKVENTQLMGLSL